MAKTKIPNIVWVGGGLAAWYLAAANGFLGEDMRDFAVRVRGLLGNLSRPGGGAADDEAACAQRILAARPDIAAISEWSGGRLTEPLAIVREWLRITTESVDKSSVCAAARSLGV